MSDQPATTSGHEAPSVAATTAVTVDQAAAMLGVSVTTVKRRIRSGALRAEQVHRPQGTVWLVYLDPAAKERSPAASVAATAPTTPTAQAEAMVALIQTTIATVLGPLVAEQTALRQTVERQTDVLRTLERENGMQAAELERAAAAVVALGEETATLKASQTQQAWRPATMVAVGYPGGAMSVAVVVLLTVRPW